MIRLGRPLFPAIVTFAYAAIFVILFQRFGWNSAATAGLLLLVSLVTPALWLYLRQNRDSSSPWTASTAAGVAAGFVLVAAPAAWFWNQGQLIPDEGTYLFQARMYAQGQISLPSPSALEEPGEAAGFIHTIHHRGRWFGKYPPGWPLVLAAATVIGADWLVNVLLGALLIGLAMWIGSEVYSARCGFLAALFLAAGPFFFFTAMGRMAHMLCSVLVAAAILFCLRAARDRTTAPYLAMLALLIGAIQVRPYTGAVIGAVLAGFTLWTVRDSTRLLAARSSAGLLAGMLAFAVMASYNHAVTGSYLLTPYSLANASGLLPAELAVTPAILFDNLVHRFRWSLESELLFTGPFLLPAAFYAVWRDRRRRDQTVLLAVVAVSLLLAHLPTTMPPGGRWGDRFHSESLIAYLLVCARGIELAAAQLHAPAMRTLLGCLLLIQTTHLACGYREFFEDTRPVARLREAEARVPAAHDVALIAAEGRTRTGFIANHWNPTMPDWQAAGRIYLIDPGPAGRHTLATALGRCQWVVFTYQAAAGSVRVEREQRCGP